MRRVRRPSFRALAFSAGLLVALVASAVFAEEATPAPTTFKEEELAALLAPVALYPDSVLTQILIASTYPLEVVTANRWVQQNAHLSGEALAREAKKQPWDPSVQGLTAVPDVLKMMDEKLDWTQKLGDAFLAQQKDVMAMIQTLRAKAKQEGNLKSDEHMKVTIEAAPTATATATTTPQVIVIESANPQVIYVPTYSPVTIYGSWWYPAYPPYYWPPPMGYPGSGFWWGVGAGVAISHWGHHYSHYNTDWHGGDINIGEINIDRGDRNQINAGNRVNASSQGGNQKWSHNPEHRKGVSYRDNATSAKYNRASATGAGTRDAYRGRTSAGTSDFRGGGASAGSRGLGSSTRGGASAGTRDVSRGTGGSLGGRTASSGARSWGGGSGSAFGGMGSGSRAGSYSSRGGMSRGGGFGGGGRRR